MEGSKISWTENTFNPWIGCTKISPGCARCYAEVLVKDRWGESLWGPAGARRVTGADNWAKPRRWDRQAAREGRRIRVFCASLCDVFEDHPTANAQRPALWGLVRSTPHLDWQLLTKRAERIASCLPADWGDGWPNVWLGVSVEDQEYAQRRVPLLLSVPAVVHFLSCEPLLGPVGLSPWLAGLEWVIVGGESGRHIPSEPGRRMDLDWARSLRDQCRAAGVAFFFKQSSAVRTEMGTTLDGETIQELPQPARRPGPDRLFAD